jgi:hypothetical protein
MPARQWNNPTRKEQIKALILGSTEYLEPSLKSRLLARVLLNKVTKNKVISKQECMYLAGLNLVSCSESIRNSQYFLYKLEHNIKQKNPYYLSMLRPITYKDMTLHQFFFFIKQHNSQSTKTNNSSLRGRSYPAYPVTNNMQNQFLLFCVPWIAFLILTTQTKTTYKILFIASNDCPKSVKVAYGRVKTRYYEKNKHFEPISNTNHRLRTFLKIATWCIGHCCF